MKQLLYVFLVVLAFSACLEDESYTTSPDAALTFRRDTVNLGLALANQPTGTDTFKIYNLHKEAIRIPRIWLEGGEQSPFRVNVDGQFLEKGAATDFEILGKDSLLAFIFVKTPDADADDSVRIEDKIHFVTEGGKEQSLVLTAYSQSVLPLNGTLLHDTLLAARRPYQITDSLVVAPGVTLRLAPGTRLYFHTGAELIVRGTLLAEGTVEQNVVLRGDRVDNMLSQLPYDRMPNQWGGVRFAASSYGNVLRNTDVHGGAYGLKIDSCDLQRETLLLDGSVIHNVSGDGLYGRHCRLRAVNTQISNAGRNCLSLFGGDYTFVHCTVAQFYPLMGGEGVALNFANHDGDIRLPVERLLFQNCLITGRNTDDVMGDRSERFQDDAFNYRFENCLLNTPKVEDENFLNCLWEEDEKEHRGADNFAPAFDYDKLLFSFQLDSLSQAIGHADPEISRTQAPTDRLGYNRLTDNASDIGCYEHRTGNDNASRSRSLYRRDRLLPLPSALRSKHRSQKGKF